MHVDLWAAAQQDRGAEASTCGAGYQRRPASTGTARSLRAGMVTETAGSTPTTKRHVTRERKTHVAARLGIGAMGAMGGEG